VTYTGGTDQALRRADGSSCKRVTTEGPIQYMRLRVR
jgi:hypothetical protein